MGTISQDQPAESGPSPPNLLNRQISLLTPVVYDGVPLFKSFGDVHSNAKSSYTVVSRPVIVMTSMYTYH